MRNIVQFDDHLAFVHDQDLFVHLVPALWNPCILPQELGPVALT